MAQSPYFTIDEESPLAIPDNSDTPTTGYVSSRKVPVAEGQGTPLANQVLTASTASGLSEKTMNVAGSQTYVSWLTRDTLNEYGATKLPPKD